MLIDTHTHIFDPEFLADRDAMVQRALDADVQLMLLPNVDQNTMLPLRETCEHFPHCTRPMMGLQPEEVRDDYKTVLDAMADEIGHNPSYYIGVGEIGLDFYWDSTYRTQQLDAFDIQLDWAVQLGLPVSIHCRNASDDMVRILEKRQDGRLHGIMHCFTGTPDEARTWIGLGMHLGLGGVTTYKSCKVREFLPELPTDRLVLETDAPYLAPVPHRGQRNEPAFLADTAAYIAQMLQMTTQQLADITTQNAKSLFKL